VALSPLQPLVVAALEFTACRNSGRPGCCGRVRRRCSSCRLRPWRGAGTAIAALATAAVFVALCPALTTLLPFFPGERWNLYFGSEPLYLLLAVSGSSRRCMASSPVNGVG